MIVLNQDDGIGRARLRRHGIGEARLGQPVQRVGLDRQKAAAQFVLALRARLEAGES